MAECELVAPDWAGAPCIVAAPGPSLTEDVANECRMARWFRGWRIIAVQDAYKRLPLADALYGCNPSWWDVHKDCGGFPGEKWSTHHEDVSNNKLELADQYGIRIVRGEGQDVFSFDPAVINYGSNSGFQAINLALLKGCRKIVLVGFDMRCVGSQAHFFGDHPKGLHNCTDDQYRGFIVRFKRAMQALPAGVSIVNATPGSALTCFPMVGMGELKYDARGMSPPEGAG